ncbi:hypothetical protein ES288_D07G011900v1 [Gossypium darwinii]|uniref:Uncharacterized protein n=1 Tax=Gossypium darwinii TaxID=34276 RepID=A0A5D2BTJ0_GOSDA|nr:hypothetical protein ES288_D07G011900v1 [Gossypium darwinii]
MPGTIQVSVLDFKGLQSTSPSSQSVKVSMGKTEYQTCDKGEFLFPLTTLHDNLIITLQDADGNEITHAVVETKLVVEKGVWDNIFSLEGGCHVHMKLQFVLSEEEHQRIRVMREAALKKKHEELCESGHGSPERASIGYSEVSVPLELENVNTSKKQGPAVKAHSNIKKMISAFEGSLNQDVKPSAKPPPTVSRTRKIGMANSHLNDVETEKMVPPKVDVDAATATEINGDGNNSEKLRPRSENSEDPQDSIGPFGQVIKVIIMVGFATLVLLTRKRTYR